METNNLIIAPSDSVLITGSNGFIGTRVVKTLLDYGFVNLKCLVRPSSKVTAMKSVIGSYPEARVELITGNLLSQRDCDAIARDIRVVYHLAGSIRDTSFETSYLNNVVTTRNLLRGVGRHRSCVRFVNVSSLAVYSNMTLKHGALIDETCGREEDPLKRGDAYCHAKMRQEDMVVEFCTKHDLAYVILRPGVVYGPGNADIHKKIGRTIGNRRFAIFLHLGGSNEIPASYVDNCADAIVLAGMRKGIDGQIFNVVDDALPTSRKFLKAYKQNIRMFTSVPIPYTLTYAASWLWEKYALKRTGRLPQSFNRRKCSAAWKGNRYTNEKLKKMLDWEPKITFDEAWRRCHEGRSGSETACEGSTAGAVFRTDRPGKKTALPLATLPAEDRYFGGQ